MPDQSAANKTIAITRIATGFLFLLFGEYKIAGPAFAHGDFQKYLDGFIQTEAVSFYRPLLVHIVAPHVVFWGYFVGILELWIAASLILGIFVRPTSIVGALFMLNITALDLVGRRARRRVVALLRCRTRHHSAASFCS